MAQRPVRCGSRSWLAAVLALAACATPGPSGEPAGDAPSGARASILEATTPRAVPAATRTPDVAAQPPAGVDEPDRPGRLLIYSAITGHVPLDDPRRPTPQTPAEAEAARARALEAEIADELARQEQIGFAEAPTPAGAAAPILAPPEPDPNPRRAPLAPALRELPGALFESEPIVIPAGGWHNRSELRVLRRSLDADRDGRPEEVRYVDATTGAVVRSEVDLDFDGRLDAWTTWQDGVPAVRVLDSNGDGQRDTWERYADGRLEAKTLDRDGDGVKDTFYRYDGEWLVEKLEDANADGTIDRTERYQAERLVDTREDRSLNGSVDTWTSYAVVDGREVVAGIRRDTRQRGRPDVFETYETVGGVTRLLRREEDVDGDGAVDIVSVYEEGRLVQRAISDEALSPL